MKALKVISFLLLTSVLAGCSVLKRSSTESEALPTVPKAISTVKDGINLNIYHSFFVGPIQYADGEYDRFGVRETVERNLTRLGLRSISEYEARLQSPEEAARTLYCWIEHHHSDDGRGGSYANMHIFMHDITQQVIYSGRSRYQGLSIEEDLGGAVNLALEGFSNRYDVFDPSIQSSATASLEARVKELSEWETINKSQRDLQVYFDTNLENLDPIEGIWTDENNHYQVGIFRHEGNGKRDLVAIILRIEHLFWKPGQVKMEFDHTAYNYSYNASYYRGNHTKQNATAFINESGLLQIEMEEPKGSPVRITLTKDYPVNLASGQGNVYPDR